MAYTAYSKTTWVDSGTPAINATNLNNIESGISNIDTKVKSYLLKSDVGAIKASGDISVLAFDKTAGVTEYGGSATSAELYINLTYPSGIVVPSGYHTAIISANASFSIDNNGTQRGILLYRVRGSEVMIFGSLVAPVQGDFTRCTASFSGPVEPGDYFYCILFQDSGTTMTFLDAGQINLSAVLI